jgi:hypothetical protein
VIFVLLVFIFLLFQRVLIFSLELVVYLRRQCELIGVSDLLPMLYEVVFV